MIKEELEEKIEELTQELKELDKKIEELTQELGKTEENKRWRAREKSEYYSVNVLMEVCLDEDYDGETDKCLYKTRNYFKTEEEAEAYKKYLEIKYKLLDLADELNSKNPIDWYNGNQKKYDFSYDFI